MPETKENYVSSIDESKVEKISSSLTSQLIQEDLNQYDVALKFIKEHNIENAIFESSDESDLKRDVNNQNSLPKYLLRKLDKYVLSFMVAIYFLQFLDKTLLNYSAVMGIKKNLKNNEFSNLATIFNAAYIFGEPIVSYLLQRFPLSKILSFFIVCWGIVVAAHSACHTYAALMVVRTLLGIFESSSAVSLIAIGTMYYTKSEQAERIGYWSIQSGTGTMVGGLLSFAFQHVHSTKFQSWQILFLLFGIVTIVFGIFVWFYLPDNVTTAWFLTEEEKILVIQHIRSNQTGIENKQFKKSQIRELFLEDKLTWLIFFFTITSQLVTGALGTFSTSITATFGFTSKVSALLQLPSGAVIIICILASTQLVSRYGRLTLFHTLMYVPAVVGAIMLLSLPLTNKIGNLFGLYLLYSGSCALPMIYTWNSVNTAGYTKKVFRNAMTLIAFATASIIGPQMFRADSFPKYIPAKIAILVTQIVSIPLSLLIGYLTKIENDKRDRLKEEEEGQEELPQNYEFMDLTDIENKNFRYLY
jgi:MFS family permease